MLRSRLGTPASESFGLLRHHTGRPHHVHYAGDKTEQQEDDETPGRSRQQAIETPSESRSSKDTSDQFGREAKPDGHGGCLGLGRVLLIPRLVSLEFAAATDTGQALIEISKPCGKRGFVRRLIATSVSAFARAFSHAAETRYDTSRKGNCAPSPLKSRADHTERVQPSQGDV